MGFMVAVVGDREGVLRVLSWMVIWAANVGAGVVTCATCVGWDALCGGCGGWFVLAVDGCCVMAVGVVGASVED